MAASGSTKDLKSTSLDDTCKVRLYFLGRSETVFISLVGRKPIDLRDTRDYLDLDIFLGSVLVKRRFLAKHVSAKYVSDKFICFCGCGGLTSSKTKKNAIFELKVVLWIPT